MNFNIQSFQIIYDFKLVFKVINYMSKCFERDVLHNIYIAISILHTSIPNQLPHLLRADQALGNADFTSLKGEARTLRFCRCSCIALWSSELFSLALVNACFHFCSSAPISVAEEFTLRFPCSD